MQMAVPEALGLQQETAETLALYGMNDKVTEPFGKLCLTARPLWLSEACGLFRYSMAVVGAGAWDAHGELKKNHSSLSAQVDVPIAALLKDLKRSGLLDDTIVVWGTEFGRTPGAQGADGRDHHPNAFCAWLAGWRSSWWYDVRRRPMSLAFMQPRIRVMLQTFTPRSCIS